MKKVKLSKEEKQARKLKRDFHRLRRLLGEEQYKIMVGSILDSGFYQGKITEEEYNNLQKLYLNAPEEIEEGDDIAEDE